MSDRGSNSGSRSLIEYEDVTPGKSASQVGSSVSRASEVARRAAAEVQARMARRRAARELQIAAIRDEIVEMETEGAKEALEIEDEVFQRELRKMGSSSRRSVSEPRRVRSWARDGQEADGKDSEGSETIYRDEDVRVRVPKQTSSRAHSTSQRRSDANSATRKIEQGPGQETREMLKAAESNLASSRRSITSLELRPGKRPSDQSEVIEGSQSSRRQDGGRRRCPFGKGIKNYVPTERENENTVQRMGGTKPHSSNSEKSKPSPAGRDEPDGPRKPPEVKWGRHGCPPKQDTEDRAPTKRGSRHSV